MIELTHKTKQDFLSRKWIHRLMEAGIDMKDAKYAVIQYSDGKDYIVTKDWINRQSEVTWEHQLPTYTLSELLYKLNEWPSLKKEGDKLIGTPIRYWKDAPFYGFGYYFSQFRLRAGIEKEEGCLDKPLRDCIYIKEVGDKEDDIEVYSEYPIEAAAMLLIKSANSKFHNFKYCKDVSDK